MLFFLNTFDKHFPLKNKSLLTIFSSTMILSSRIYSVPPLFLPERIPLHTMRYHLIVTYPNQTSDTQSHKVAMFSKQSFPGWNRCISPQLPSVPMQTNQSSVSLPSTHLFLYQTEGDGRRAEPADNSRMANGITIQHIPFFIFTYHFRSKFIRSDATALRFKDHNQIFARNLGLHRLATTSKIHFGK
mgnify:FL=1